MATKQSLSGVWLFMALAHWLHGPVFFIDPSEVSAQPSSLLETDLVPWKRLPTPISQSVVHPDTLKYALILLKPSMALVL